MSQFSPCELDGMFSSMEAYSCNTYSSSSGGSGSLSPSRSILGFGGGGGGGQLHGSSSISSGISSSGISSSSSSMSIGSSGSDPFSAGTRPFSSSSLASSSSTASSSGPSLAPRSLLSTLEDGLVVAGDPRLIVPKGEFVWLDEANSTMDEAKQRVPLRPGLSTLALQAGMQVQGRGTKGRQWFGRPGNVFLTVVLPMDKVPVPMSLLPLRVGVFIARAIKGLIDEAAAEKAQKKDEQQQQQQQQQQPAAEAADGAAEPFPTGGFATATVSETSLKWPNDVLVNDDKVAGVLIEGDGTYVHIGIGINVRHAPEVPDLGRQRGRTSTCLADHGVLRLRCAKRTKTWVNEGGHGSLLEVDEEEAEREANEYDPEVEAAEDAADDLDTLVAVQGLGVTIAKQLMAWVGNSGDGGTAADSAEAVVADWTALANWSKPLVLRDEGPPDVTVLPLALEPDGRLRVKNHRDGTERVLVAEYLF
jgi:biotin-(acetyl-CoA carboxylase) ligase